MLLKFAKPFPSPPQRCCPPASRGPVEIRWKRPCHCHPGTGQPLGNPTDVKGMGWGSWGWLIVPSESCGVETGWSLASRYVVRCFPSQWYCLCSQRPCKIDSYHSAPPCQILILLFELTDSPPILLPRLMFGHVQVIELSPAYFWSPVACRLGIRTPKISLGSSCPSSSYHCGTIGERREPGNHPE